jgi:polyhydroxyalkanoate synthesis regulator phasin
MKYATLLALTFTLLLSACEEKGPAEKAGEKVDEMMEKTGKKIDDAVDGGEDLIDEAKDKANEVGNKIEDACEETKEAADAKDTDC